MWGLALTFAAPEVGSADELCPPGHSLQFSNPFTHLSVTAPPTCFPSSPTPTASLTPVPTFVPDHTLDTGPGDEFVYVAHPPLQFVSVVDPTNGSTVATLHTYSTPTRLFPLVDGRLVVAESGGVQVLDPSAMQLGPFLVVGASSTLTAVVPDEGSLVIVTSTAIERHDLASGALTGTLGLPAIGSRFTLAPLVADSEALFAASYTWDTCNSLGCRAAASLSRRPLAGQSATTVPLELLPPTAVDLGPQGSGLTVTSGVRWNRLPMRLTTFERATLTRVASRDFATADAVAYGPAGDWSLVAAGNQLLEVAMPNLDPIGAATLPARAVDVAISPDGAHAYATLVDQSQLALFDRRSRVVSVLPSRGLGAQLVALPRPPLWRTPTPTPVVQRPVEECLYALTESGLVAINQGTGRVAWRSERSTGSFVIVPQKQSAYILGSASELSRTDLTNGVGTYEVAARGARGLLLLGAERVATIGNDSVRVFDSDTLALQYQLPAGAFALYAADVDAVVVWNFGEESRIEWSKYRGSDGAVIGSGKIPFSYVLSTISPDARYLYGTLGDGHIGCVELATGAVVWDRARNSRYPWALGALSPSGDRLLVNDGNDVLALDARTGEVLNTLPGALEPRTVTRDGRVYFANQEQVVVTDQNGVLLKRIDVPELQYFSPLVVADVAGGCEDDGAPLPTHTVTETPTSTWTRVPTRTRTATRTSTPTRTVTQTPVPGRLRVETELVPGQLNALLSLRFEAGAESTVGVEVDVAFDPRLPIGTAAGGRPDCTVEPAINKPQTTFAFQPVGCRPGTNCTGVRAVVVAVDNTAPIATGSLLFHCRVPIPPTFSPGVYPVVLQRAHLSTDKAELRTAITEDGAIEIGGSVCGGDCDGSGEVEIDEVLRCVRIGFGAAPLSRCPAADTNLDGSLTLEEIVAAVRHAQSGCSPGSSPK